MAHLGEAQRSRQYQHRSAAVEIARTEPDRKHLAVHARQLALQPRVHIWRGYRRSLLRRLEQARRTALAHHVHRSTRLGPRVVICEGWYYAEPPRRRRYQGTHRSLPWSTSTVRLRR